MVADTLQSLKEPITVMQEINQVTLLVLALFFILCLLSALADQAQRDY